MFSGKAVEKIISTQTNYMAGWLFVYIVCVLVSKNGVQIRRQVGGMNIKLASRSPMAFIKSP